MGIWMTRTWPALVGFGVAIVVLLALVSASRPLEDQAFERHYQLLNALSASAASYEALLTELQAGRRGIARLGEVLPVLRERLGHAQRALALTSPAAADAGPADDHYTASLAAVLSGTERTATQVQTLQDALASLSELGPVTVRQLRAALGDTEASLLYALWLDVYEYGRGAQADPDSLRARIAATATADAALVPQHAATIASMQDVVDAARDIESARLAIEGADLVSAASDFAAQVRTAHAARLRARDRARLWLGGYGVLLICALSLLAYRLHRKQHALNDAHGALRLIDEQREERDRAPVQATDDATGSSPPPQVESGPTDKWAALGRLAAGIRHEIDTPLLYLQSNATLTREALLRIDNFIDLCHRVLSPQQLPDESIASTRARFLAHLQVLRQALIDNDVREEVREVIALTDDSIDGLGELTRLAESLKDFSRIDRGPVERFDLNDCVARVVRRSRNRLGDHVTVTSEFGAVPPLYCAAAQIEQVLLNLITNAAQAIDGQGEIALQTGTEGDFALLRVRDTGCGIRPELIDRIRDPFFTTRDVGKGAGLGLSIAEAIVRQHDGRLEVQSTPGEGTTVTVCLPLGRAAPGAGERRPGDEPATDFEGVAPAPTAQQGTAERDASAPPSGGIGASAGAPQATWDTNGNAAYSAALEQQPVAHAPSSFRAEAGTDDHQPSFSPVAEVEAVPGEASKTEAAGSDARRHRAHPAAVVRWLRRAAGRG